MANFKEKYGITRKEFDSRCRALIGLAWAVLFPNWDGPLPRRITDHPDIQFTIDDDMQGARIAWGTCQDAPYARVRLGWGYGNDE